MPEGNTLARDLVCLSHLRWDYVYQRPQHLLSRAARTRRVFYWEEPRLTGGARYLEVAQRLPNLWVATPHIPDCPDPVVRAGWLRALVDQMLAGHAINDFVLWYYTPNSLRYTRHLKPAATVYDCMDELTLFRGANPMLRDLEAELFGRANLVFTGGRSLYEAKRDRHRNVHLFPSSIDRDHFAQARGEQPEPADQATIPHPRLGFFGVIDERIDLALIDGLAQARPDWHIVLVGPVAKIEESALPRRPNIHYLGGKPYAQLPRYLAGWDVALMPFAHNPATRFISPTKTPEYLAGGVPVVSTAVRDVIRPYGQLGLVRTADTPADFMGAVDAAMAETETDRQRWLQQVDAHLAANSWDLTWKRMDALIEQCAGPGPAQAADTSVPQSAAPDAPSTVFKEK